MCGIAGLWNFGSDAVDLATLAKDMAGRMRHRGPDSLQSVSRDHWALGHARLSIIDIEGGTQPIWNEDETVAIVGNNEIYNYQDLRGQLLRLGHRFKTGSDTEVVLHAWEQWGESCFSMLNGMFAFAIVDTNKKCCALARDPLGIKPLHYTLTSNGGVAFGSEIKSLLGLQEIRTSPDWDSIHLFMNYRYVPGNTTLFKNIQRLPPGAIAVIDEASNIKITSYYDLPRAASSLTHKQAKEELSDILQRSVSRHLIADVEIGTYLSGGIDSSTVSTLAAQRTKGIKSFCIGFGDQHDENSDAQRIAKNIGSTHEDIYVSRNIFDEYKRAIWHVEEPKINCLQGFLLAQNVSKKVKVALSGLGGDELFAGYDNNDYLFPMTKLSMLYSSTRISSLSHLQSLLRNIKSDHYFRALELGVNSFHPLGFYSILRNSFDHNEFLMNSIYAQPKKHWKNFSFEALKQFYDDKNPDILNELLLLEMKTKLPNDFLLTEDRVSMAHSLEVRVPLLDKELVEFACRLPSSEKYRLGNKKYLLKEAVEQWLPADVLNKRKWGFSFTPHLIFESHLRPMALQTLNRKKVEEMGLFSWPWIEKVINSRPSPNLRWHYFNLWVMIGFVHWFDLFWDGKNEFES